LIATNYAVRFDAKYADHQVRAVLDKISAAGCFQLGEYLPFPFVKGIQPDYLDQPTDDSVPVISTLAIQNLAIRERDCRHISRDDFDVLIDGRRLQPGDVLLTVDGGVSIGKPCLFEREDDYATDSHVVVLRPEGVGSLALVYLLASPLGQMQFRRAESGASGQTTVTEDDIRRFVFPRSILKTIDKTAKRIEEERKRIAEQRAKLDDEEHALWSKLAALSK
jgi:hypothetical protein